MCIAFVATKEQGLPTDETLAHIYKSNPDGAGYVSIFTTPDKEKKMRMEKGIMTYEDFHTKLTNAYKDMNSDDDYIVAHTRIATSGGISKEKTHPFMMQDGSFLFHNGIASGVSSFLHDEESDTEWLAKHCKGLEDVILYDAISRYIVIKPDGTYDITNNWVTDDDGRLWTNDGHEPYFSRHYGSKYSTHSGYGGYPYGGFHGNYYDDDYFKSKKTKTTNVPPINVPSILDTTLGEIADANKDSTACADGSCTVFTPYTRRDFARYELLKGLSRHKTIRRIEHTIKHNDLEYDREANTWFSGMKKINLEIKGGNVVIKDIATTADSPTTENDSHDRNTFDKYDWSNWIPHWLNDELLGKVGPFSHTNAMTEYRITTSMRKTLLQMLEDITTDTGIDPDTLFEIRGVKVDDDYKFFTMIYRINNVPKSEANHVPLTLASILALSEHIYEQIFDNNFA